MTVFIILIIVLCASSFWIYLAVLEEDIREHKEKNNGDN